MANARWFYSSMGEIQNIHLISQFIVIAKIRPQKYQFSSIPTVAYDRELHKIDTGHNNDLNIPHRINVAQRINNLLEVKMKIDWGRVKLL